MKDTTKRKLKKTIYAALVLSYILIITTITTQAASGTVYWNGHTTIDYTEQDGREATYPSYTDISVTYTNTQVVNMDILITNVDETIYMYASQDLSGFNITYNGTTYGAQFYQALYEIWIKDAVLDKDIYTQIRTQVEYIGSSQLKVKVRFSIPESSGTSMYSLLSNFHNSNTDMTDSYVTSWGMIILANAVIREQTIEGTVNSRDLIYTGSYKTPIEIDNMITQNFNGILNNLYDSLNQPFEPEYTEIQTGEEYIKDLYEQLYDEQSKENFIQSVENSIIELEESTTIVYVTTLLTDILSLPFVISIVPVGMFFVVTRLLLH